MRILTLVFPLFFFSQTTLSQETLFDGSHQYVYSANKTTIRTTAPRYKGEYYKIQIIIVAQFSQKDPALKELATFGRVDNEYIVEKKHYRILVGDFWDATSVDTTIKKLKKLGYGTAFRVRYKNGIRVNN